MIGFELRSAMLEQKWAQQDESNPVAIYILNVGYVGNGMGRVWKKLNRRMRKIKKELKSCCSLNSGSSCMHIQCYLHSFLCFGGKVSNAICGWVKIAMTEPLNASDLHRTARAYFAIHVYCGLFGQACQFPAIINGSHLPYKRMRLKPSIWKCTRKRQKQRIPFQVWCVLVIMYSKLCWKWKTFCNMNWLLLKKKKSK